MRHLQRRTALAGPLFLLLAATALPISVRAQQSSGFSIEISAERSRIHVGEPLTVKMTIHTLGASMDRQSAGGAKSTRNETTFIEIVDAQDQTVMKKLPIYPFEMHREGDSSIRYTGHFVLWYNPMTTVRPLFESAGDFRIRAFLGGRALASNALSISVEPPTEAERRAIDLLNNEPNNYAFVLDGYHYGGGLRVKMSHIRRIIDEAPASSIAKWCSARLGIECINRRRELVDPNDPESRASLLSDAHRFLSEGAKLSDDAPVRPEVLYHLAKVERVNGNSIRADALEDELTKKYSYSRPAKRLTQERDRKELSRGNGPNQKEPYSESDPNKGGIDSKEGE